jgi:hypothetical protein
LLHQFCWSRHTAQQKSKEGKRRREIPRIQINQNKKEKQSKVKLTQEKRAIKPMVLSLQNEASNFGGISLSDFM